MSAAAWSESALSFDCQGVTLQGVIAAPALPRPVGVVVVVGGPQYRAGSHRQFVELARGLAAAGVATLRFDVRGMGDSEGTPQGFEQQSADIAAAVQALCAAVPQVQQVVLFGLCDGASAALLYVHEPGAHAVAGLALLNPWVRTEATLARTHVKHYYTQRLLDPTFWRKLLRGGVGLTALRGLVSNLRAMGGGPRGSDLEARPQAPYTDRMAQAWTRFRRPILLLISEHDLTAQEFEDTQASAAAWRGTRDQAGATRVPLRGADHTLSQPGNGALCLAAVCRWLDRYWPVDRQTRASSDTASPVPSPLR